jgi:hypothetical protein
LLFLVMVLLRYKVPSKVFLKAEETPRTDRDLIYIYIVWNKTQEYNTSDEGGSSTLY